MTPYRDINDEEWQRVTPLLPELRPRSELRGRPLANTRSVLNGVLWVMYSGATWSAMPRKYPSYQTCHRRFKAWHESGVLKRVMDELFGEASGELCGMMESRMRVHVSPEEKAVRAEAAPVVQDRPPLFGQAGSQPAVPSVFGFAGTFKRAA
jgi:transposase